nr:hypothetical protein [Tanacetum cinerariifolium]
ADNSFPEYDSFCFEIEPDQERLINIVKNDISDDSTNDPLIEEVDLFLASKNLIPPGIENIGYDLEGDICFLKELLIDDFVPFPDSEASDFDDPVSYPSGYYLVDGIYPELASLVKTISEPADDDHKRILYKQKQESARKDVERAFGVLKKKWAVIAYLTRAQKKKELLI